MAKTCMGTLSLHIHSIGRIDLEYRKVVIDDLKYLGQKLRSRTLKIMYMNINKITQFTHAEYH